MTDLSNKITGISILIPSYNTPKKYIDECILSIINQTCIKKYNFEIVWINDGSDINNSTNLEESLEIFKKFPSIKLIYKKLDSNKGIVDALNIGLDLCTNELIFRMDSDDIMIKNRMEIQVKFMEQNPQCMILGTQIQSFENKNNKIYFNNQTALPEILLWSDFLKKPSEWFMCHPTLCYRKQAIEKIGKYNDKDSIIKFSKMEDWELELRFLKHFGVIFNLPIILLNYRCHDKQSTKFLNSVSNNIKEHIISQNNIRKYIINKIMLDQ